MLVTIAANGLDPLDLECDPKETIKDIKIRAAKKLQIDYPFDLSFFETKLDDNTVIESLKNEDDEIILIIEKAAEAEKILNEKRAAPTFIPRTDNVGPIKEPSDINELVATITEMGFTDEELVRKALRVSFYNTRRAVDFLLGGYVPEEPTSAIILDCPKVPPRRSAAAELVTAELEKDNHKAIFDNVRRINMYAETLCNEKLYSDFDILQYLSSTDWDEEKTIELLDLKQFIAKME